MLKNNKKKSTSTSAVARVSSQRWKFLTFKRKREETMPEQSDDRSVIPDAVQPAAPDTAQICPKCSSQMLRRVAVYGSEAGNEFWGCSRFPACTGVRWC